MPPPLPPSQVAVIADAHFHDSAADYGQGPGWPFDLALRPLADVARTPRVVNETGAALRAALDAVVARGIRIVVLLGDYSDDGQAATLAGLDRLLTRYTRRHGLRCYATPGNHDMFADAGRHRSRRFLNAQGGHDLVTSDPCRTDATAGRVIVSPAMYCHGAVRSVAALPGVGFFRRDGDLLWESPFGLSDRLEDRHYRVVSTDGVTERRLVDLSYLVEPEPGLWLLMIDANVFVPFDQAERGAHAEDYADSTDAGWQAMLTHKPFIPAWMAQVAQRAAAQGKRLLTFTHYPVLDACAAGRADAQALFGPVPMVRRLPGAEVAQTVLRTGIATVFSGHLHQNDMARVSDAAGFLVNIGVPSLAAFPGAFKVASVDETRLTFDTVSVGAMPMPAQIRQAYQAERVQTGRRPTGLAGAETYGAFLEAHAAHLVARRHLRREWPPAVAEMVATLTLADLAAMAGVGDPVMDRALAGIAGLTFVQDWYLLLAGGDLGLSRIPAARLQAYKTVSELFAAGTQPEGPAQAFARLFRLFDLYCARLPSDRAAIDLATGEVTPT